MYLVGVDLARGELMSDQEKPALVNIETHLGEKAEATACELIKELLGSAIREGALLLGNQVAYWKWANTIRLANKVRERLKGDGFAARSMPPAFVVPLLETAATVDDEVLQDM